ncbi:fungal-specific transcription factor domain-containing protein, partial [Phascolomyces articulosus]
MEQDSFPFATFLQDQLGITIPEIPIIDNDDSSIMTRKRKNSGNTKSKNNNEGTIMNKRSCDTCRKRKVRCNGNIQYPCAECKKHGIDCQFLILPRKRGRRSKEYIESLESRLGVIERLLEKNLTRRTNGRQTNPLQLQQSLAPPIVLQSQLLPPLGLQQPYGNQRQTPTMTQTINQHERQSTMELIERIPNLTFEFTERMIRAYFESPHPRWVFIDKHAFLMQFYYQYPRPLDEHLFYALCAVGCQFVPSRTQQEVEIAKYLRDIAMAHAKSLALSTPVASSSAITLLLDDNKGGESNGYDTRENVLLRSSMSSFSTNWLMLGAAVRMCQDLDLHRESPQSNLSESEIELRRRVAYSVYSLDRIAAAASGKPIMMKDENFHVQLPTAYEIETLTTTVDIDYEHTRPSLLVEAEANIRDKKPIYTTFLRIIPLSKTMGQVLTSLYQDIPRDIDGPSPLSYIVGNLDNALIKWQSKTEEENCFANDTGILSAVYNSAVLLLYRPLIDSCSTITIDTADTNEQQQQKQNQDVDQLQRFCTTVAVSVIDWLDATHVAGLPCLMDYMVGQAASVFVQNCSSTDKAIRIQAQKYLTRCASLYQRDNVVNQCQNAAILNQLVAQEKSNNNMDNLNSSDENN